jgi:hypothetical protein
LSKIPDFAKNLENWPKTEVAKKWQKWQKKNHQKNQNFSKIGQMAKLT